jgi:creatinine amidohydrolase/Fe(II)-dependent formamide hydrolase-like protein
MKQLKLIALLVLLISAVSLLAQQPAAPAAGQGAQAAGQRGEGQRGQRGQPEPLTPEEEKIKAAAQERLKRPMGTLDTIWIEEMTDPEVREAIKNGKTTGIILTGGTESNGPHLASGKHNFILRQTGESIARKLGNALVAPIVTLEPGQVDRAQIGGGWPSLSQATYRAVLADMGDSMRGMGFKNILYLGDSGSNTGGMQFAANTLNDKYKGEPARFYHIPEYYDYRSVQEYIQHDLKIPEQLRLTPGRTASNGWSDGIHEEYAIDALMSLEDPKTIRFDQRVKAGRAIINGVPLTPLKKLQEHGKLFLELRTKLTVAGITKALAAPPPRYGQPTQQQ